MILHPFSQQRFIFENVFFFYNTQIHIIIKGSTSEKMLLKSDSGKYKNDQCSWNKSWHLAEIKIVTEYFQISFRNVWGTWGVSRILNHMDLISTLSSRVYAKGLYVHVIFSSIWHQWLAVIQLMSAPGEPPKGGVTTHIPHLIACSLIWSYKKECSCSSHLYQSKVIQWCHSLT